jgi:hypothetical protein
MQLAMPLFRSCKARGRFSHFAGSFPMFASAELWPTSNAIFCDLARVACLNPRKFTRVFRTETLPLETAKFLLERAATENRIG